MSCAATTRPAAWPQASRSGKCQARRFARCWAEPLLCYTCPDINSSAQVRLCGPWPDLEAHVERYRNSSARASDAVILSKCLQMSSEARTKALRRKLRLRMTCESGRIACTLLLTEGHASQRSRRVQACPLRERQANRFPQALQGWTLVEQLAELGISVQTRERLRLHTPLLAGRGRSSTARYVKPSGFLEVFVLNLKL